MADCTMICANNRHYTQKAEGINFGLFIADTIAGYNHAGVCDTSDKREPA